MSRNREKERRVIESDVLERRANERPRDGRKEGRKEDGALPWRRAGACGSIPIVYTYRT